MLGRIGPTMVVAIFAAAACTEAGGDPVSLRAGDPAPSASAGGPYTAVPNSAVRFSAVGSRDAAGNPDDLTFVWDFGDGTVGTGRRPEHAYAAPGTYAARVIATDAHGESSEPASALVTVSAMPEPGESAVLVGAGDIAACGSIRDDATAALLDAIDGIVVALGDNAYQDGTAAEFRNCYAHSWGRHLGRTRPAAGNHEYNTRGAAGYYEYFGARAGEPGEGYYSYDAGSWHVVVLNSNIARDAGSAQINWLREDLDAHPAECTIAYWHHPRFSSSEKHGDNASMATFWEVLYEAGVEIVLNGHVHNYERFAPQSPDRRADPKRGIRQFVVGTGGKAHYGFSATKPNSEVRSTGTDGVLRLVLADGGYTWEFVPAAGGTFRDSGSAACH